jgi:hypothetical protein
MAHAGTPFLTQPEMIQATCHCGAVSLEIDQRPASLTECNCSVCRRYAAQWAYYTRPQVRVRCPPGAVAAYVWGDRTIEFYHCTTCGCLTHYEAVEKTSDSRIAVNARMMDPADLAGVRVRKLDGASTWKYLDE